MVVCNRDQSNRVSAQQSANANSAVSDGGEYIATTTSDDFCVAIVDALRLFHVA
jgi:hypothetical protein